MIIHHFWGFPNWVIEANNYSHILTNYPEIEVVIGDFGKICVAMYAFITGYAIYINKDKYTIFRYRIKKIIRFLLSYWIFAFGFIVLGYLINENLPNITHFIANLLGLSTSVFEYGQGYICVTMAWYVSFYIFIMLILPVLLIHTHKGFILDTFIMTFIFNVFRYIFVHTFISGIPIIGKTLSNILVYAPAVLIGYYVAEYKIFNNINNLLRINSLSKIVLSVILCILIFILRVKKHIYLECS